MPKLTKDQLPTVATDNAEYVNIGGVVHRRQNIHGYGDVFAPMSDDEFNALNKFEWIIGAAYQGKTTGKIYLLQRVSGKKEGKLVALVPLIDDSGENKMSSVGAHEVTWPTTTVQGRRSTKQRAVTSSGTVVTSAKLEANADDFEFYADTALAACLKYAQENNVADGTGDGEDDDGEDF